MSRLSVDDKPRSAGLVRIVPLASEADWRACRSKLERLEEACRPNPYLTWSYQFATWLLQGAQEPCWLMEIRDEAHEEAPLVGASLMLEHARKRGWGRMKVLRSMDYNVMRMPPLWAEKGREREICRTWLDSRSELARATGASMVCLYKIDPFAAQWLVDALKEQDCVWSEETFNTSPQILLPQDMQEYWANKSGKTLKNLRRAKRICQDEQGGKLEIRRLTGDVWDKEDFQSLWTEFRRLLAETWEAWREQGRQCLPAEELLAFYEQVLPRWSRHLGLDLACLRLDDRVLAGQLHLGLNDEIWAVLMAFDSEFHRYSPGRVLFTDLLDDHRQRGFRLLELGGECLHWKNEWANHEIATMKLEWPLTDIKGRLWSLTRRFKQGMLKRRAA